MRRHQPTERGVCGWTSGRLGQEVSTVPTKDEMIKLIQELPADATVADVMERLYLLDKIERGIRQADTGQKVSQEEARQRMARWLG